MSPQVTAAWIAAGISAATLIGTLLTAWLNRRAARGDLEKQREQLDRTLAQQREQLDRTLAEQRTRTLNERFTTAAEQLAFNKSSAVRLAGVYAMAGLADDWEENRQTCVDVLCGYLRLPYDPDPGDGVNRDAQSAYWRNREVRHTIIRVITAHLQADIAEAKSWQGLNFDFTGVVFDGGNFRGARFSGGAVSFLGATFSGGTVDFGAARFSDGDVDFGSAKFSGGKVNFGTAEFCGGEVDFSFGEFSGSDVRFSAATFSSGHVGFTDTEFCGGTVDFRLARFFSGGTVYFSARFSGGAVDFRGAKFSGGEVDFKLAEFSGGTVDFSKAGDWSFPPAFPWRDTPPPGVKLPRRTEHSESGPI